MYFFGRIVIGRFKRGKMGQPLKEEILYKNYVGALIAFNEAHQGLLKLHVPLGVGRREFQ